MVKNSRKSPMRFVMAVVAGAMLGAVLGGSMLLVTRQIERQPESLGRKLEEARGVEADPVREELTGPIANEAWHYAEAVQRGDWDEVLRRVLWMQERLAYAELNEGGTAAREAAQMELVAAMEDRSPYHVDNQLRPEGVEDRFVFSPYAKIEAVAIDAGRKDLEAAVANRTWLRVTYAEPLTALRDGMNLPVRSIEVGINVSRTGMILKANAIGNLDIDEDSVTYFSGGPATAALGSEVAP